MSLAVGVNWRERSAEIRDGRIGLIDLRSPKEYLLGCIPGAINLPLLDDSERHEVGTLYKQVGRIEATQVGLEYFAAKSAPFLDALIERAQPRTGKILLHCWRGGMRSTSVALWLRSIGLHPELLIGGYKSFRREVLGLFEELARREVVVLIGRTGVGKSDLLESLPASFPGVDLERLANHRGSAFGDFAQAEPAPTQQNFENRLADRILTLGQAPRVLVEIENFIGPVTVPKPLRDCMEGAPKILLERDFDDRIERLAARYAPVWDASLQGLFETRIALLTKYISKGDRDLIVSSTAKGDFRTAISMLLRLRYDKSYDKSLKRQENQVIARFNLSHDEAGAMAFLRGHFA